MLSISQTLRFHLLLSQSSCFALRLEKAEDIIFADCHTLSASVSSYSCCSFTHTGAFDVTDDAAGSVVHEFHAHLCDTSARA